MDDKTRHTIELIQTRYLQSVEAIRADRSRSDEYKRAVLAREYLTAKKRVGDLVERGNASTVDRRRTLEAQVFGLSGLAGDVGSLAISRRDAGDRAAQLKDEQSALDLLARADRSGDEPLARAIAERATEAGWADVANAFLESRPQLDKALTELWNIRTPTLQEEFQAAMEFTVSRPSELGPLADTQLGELADAGDYAPALNSTALTAGIESSLGL